jgi:predicted DCC family thiol-disulfide oxidoreductase YuxK
MGDMKTTTREGEQMSFFEEVARLIMKQHAITTHTALAKALQDAGYARFAAIRTADKIFGEENRTCGA